MATQKHASHEGRNPLLVQPLNLDGSDRGNAMVAVDAVDAGAGDQVLVATDGFSAMTNVGRPQSPIDMAVIAFIDQIGLQFLESSDRRLLGCQMRNPATPAAISHLASSTTE